MTTKEPAQIPKGEQEHNNWPKVAIIVLNWNGWRVASHVEGKNL